MSFEQVLEELPALTTEERQILIRRVLEIKDLPLSNTDEDLARSRLASHHENPASSVSLEEMKQRLKGSSGQ